MAVDNRLKELRGSSRRDFIRWSTAVAAAIGLDRAGLLNFLNDRAGYAMAGESAGRQTMRAFYISAGNGGLANFTLPFTFHKTALDKANAAVPFYAPGTGVLATNTDHPWATHKYSPFQTLGAKDQMTAFVAGANQTHSTAVSVANGTGSLLGSMAALQALDSSLVPVIGVNPINYLGVSGSPSIATVASPTGLVGLFDSAASKALLAKPGDASMHEAYYKAFLGLNAAAGRPGVASTYASGAVAANLLGQNLASKLTPTTQDLARYGVTTSTATKFSDIARSMIIGSKAFQLGLTSMIAIPAFRDDPHGMFGAGLAMSVATAQSLQLMFDAFAADCAAMKDPAGGTGSLWESTSIVIEGDTPKDPVDNNNWGDNTPGKCNLIYARGGGFLRTGWMGDFQQGVGFDQQTGDVSTRTSQACLPDAIAAICFAIAKGKSDVAREVAPNVANLGSGVIVPTIT